MNLKSFEELSDLLDQVYTHNCCLPDTIFTVEKRIIRKIVARLKDEKIEEIKGTII